jgi:hypothetical protein
VTSSPVEETRHIQQLVRPEIRASPPGDGEAAGIPGVCQNND